MRNMFLSRKIKIYCNRPSQTWNTSLIEEVYSQIRRHTLWHIRIGAQRWHHNEDEHGHDAHDEHDEAKINKHDVTKRRHHKYPVWPSVAVMIAIKDMKSFVTTYVSPISLLQISILKKFYFICDYPKHPNSNIRCDMLFPPFSAWSFFFSFMYLLVAGLNCHYIYMLVGIIMYVSRL